MFYPLVNNKEIQSNKQIMSLLIFFKNLISLFSSTYLLIIRGLKAQKFHFDQNIF